MRALMSASQSERALLCLLAFAALLAQFAPLFAEFSRQRRLRYLLPDGALATLGLVYASRLLVAAGLFSGVQSPSPLAQTPTLALYALSAAAVAHAAAKTLLICRAGRAPGGASVKAGFDRLPSGICFADANGIVTLCNLQMHRLCQTLIGSDLQHRFELQDALENPPHGVTPSPAPGVYTFPDGRAWQFTRQEVRGREGNAFTQVTACDVTELQAQNSALAQGNERLREMNGRVARLYEQADALVREEETLAMKMKVHDDMGLGILSARRCFAQNPTLSQLQASGKLWARTVDCLRHMNLARDDDGLTGALARARETGVAVRLRGELPADGPLRALALCAIRECALNCSRHAGGTELCVRVANGSAIAITNNGAPPEGEIREGGGLSALRQRVESSGGTMKIISSPAFLLEIKLPRRETEA